MRGGGQLDRVLLVGEVGDLELLAGHPEADLPVLEARVGSVVDDALGVDTPGSSEVRTDRSGMVGVKAVRPLEELELEQVAGLLHEASLRGTLHS